MKIAFFIGLALLMASCTTREVRCDGRLQPINAPAPSARSGAAPTRSAAAPAESAAAPASSAPPPPAAHPQRP